MRAIMTTELITAVPGVCVQEARRVPMVRGPRVVGMLGRCGLLRRLAQADGRTASDVALAMP